jgi:hypothetical protein
MLLWLTVLSFYLRRLVKAKRTVLKGLATNKDIAEIVTELQQNVNLLADKVNQLTQASLNNRDLLTKTVKHIGLVKFDAFNDVGGKLSFALALLNEKGDGVVITSINGRTDTRVYAKTITGGKANLSLSAEEQAALKKSNWRKM